MRGHSFLHSRRLDLLLVVAVVALGAWWLAPASSPRSSEASPAEVSAPEIAAQSRADALVSAAMASYRGGRYQEAEKLYDKAIELAPEYARAWAARGGYRYTHLKDYQGAIEDYGRALEIGPVGPGQGGLNALVNRAWSLYMEELYEEAYQDADRAVQHFPSSAAAWDVRGCAELGRGNPRQALADIEKAIELDAHQAVFEKHRGWALERLKVE
ncbi:MAG: tetratricopeptide repeat protein [Armatimonadetes bacterium]|nr:tetratricopeptide repeat protein [Armatimonadota bacterium]